MSGRTAPAPRAVLVYGLLGIIPFWSLSAAAVLAPGWTAVAAAVTSLYAALILSFLGGARWGLAVREAAPDPIVVGLAMTPTLAGLAALVLLHGSVRLQLPTLAAALVASWAWDITAAGLPPWYGRLRTLLTLGAVGGLLAGVMQVSP
jgi:uncharacterized protein (DUF697 family)